VNDPAPAPPAPVSRSDRLKVTLRPLAAFAGMVCAGVLTYALVTVQAGGPRSEAFIESADYVVWRLLIVVLVLASLISAAVGWPRFAELRRQYPTAAVTPLAMVYPLPVLITAALPWLTQPTVAVAWSMLSVRIGIVVLIVAAGVAPAVGTVWIIRHRLGEMTVPQQDQAEHDTAAHIIELSMLRRTGGTALGVLAGIISLTVVVTSQLRRAYLAAGASPEILPAVGVVLYGSFFAGLLALLYVPAHLHWRNSAEAVRDLLYPIPTHGRPDADWSDGRKRVSDLLELDKGVPGILGMALTVTAPFLISLLGYVIPAPN
jgi:hypothetical protein